MKLFIVHLPRINPPKLSNPITTTPNRNDQHTTTTTTLMKHNMGPLANAFAITNTRMETNVSIAQTNLLVVTLQTITQETKHNKP